MRTIVLLHIIFVFFFCNLGIAQVEIRLKNTDVMDNMVPESKHTLVAEVENVSNTVQFIRTTLDLEDKWDIISGGFVGELKPLEKRLVFITIYVPRKATPGIRKGKLHLVTSQTAILKSIPLDFFVPEHHRIVVNKLSSPELVIAGEVIENTFEILNNGNVKEDVILYTDETVEGGMYREIPVDSSLVITLSRDTDKRNRQIRTENVFLKVVRNGDTKDAVRGYAMTKVYPVKMEAEDSYFRYPIEASLYYNTFNSDDNKYASFLVEAKGEGHLDLDKEHYFNFVIRTPNQNTVNRFGMNDQYTLTYDYKNEFNVIVGDYSYRANRLGFVSRYGFGLKVNYKIKDWDITTFYSKPRLSYLYTESLIGTKVLKQLSESFNLGVSISQSKENTLQYNDATPELISERGQIIVLESNFKNKHTTLNHESSVSFTPTATDFAHDIRLRQEHDNFSYNGSFTIAGDNYFGGLSNSFRYANSVRYYLQKWGIGAGQALSKVNKRYNPQYSLPEPYYENYFIFGNYRINQKHHTNVRFSNVLREDKQLQKSYHYKEYGVDYTYRYLYSGLNISFNGRVSKTRNLLSSDSQFRNTYGNNLSTSYQITPYFGIRGNINHNYTNRYGVSNLATNYYNYGLGFNLNFKGRMSLSAMYNSGFSPEDDYLQRDFINLNFRTRIHRNHKLSARINYYENALSANNKELFSFLKYTYSFGAPLKRISWQGKLSGIVFSNSEDISVDKIRIEASGVENYTNAFGKFELKNLPEGTNYVMIDEATLPQGVVAVQKMPMEIKIEKDKDFIIDIELVKSATIEGQLVISDAIVGEDVPNLEGYLKLEGLHNTYYTESDKKGSFAVKSIIPGDYKLSVIRLKYDNDLKTTNKINHLNVFEGEIHKAQVQLNKKQRAIKFKSSNFNIKM